MPVKRPVDADTGSPEAKKQCFSLGTNIIIVYVGERNARHLLHESILVQCPFFKKCLESGMRESKEKVINLPEDDPKTFSIIVEWLYTKDVRRELDGIDFTLGYVAADKYGMHELQNVLMDHLRAKLCENLKNDIRLCPTWVSDVWKYTMDGSKLRDLGLDFLHYCIATRPQSYQIQSDHPKLQLPRQMETFMADPELGLALMFRFAEKGNSKLQNPAKAVGCVYHVHQDDKKCEKSR